MTWTNGRRLATISATNDHAALGFTYDSDGLRLTKTVGTEVHKYTWQGSKLIAEQYGDTALEFFYDESGAPYAFSYKADANAAEQIFYYVTDLQGDVMQILDASGNTAASYTYNAWGKILNLNNNTSANIGDLNPIRYRGYYYDTETGLYYLKSRYYDPEICRFINADSFASTGQGFLGTNMFAYCLNNPIKLVDKTGHDASALTAEWAATMWWLGLVDGILPVGDLIYWAGIGLLTFTAVIITDYHISNFILLNQREQSDEVHSQFTSEFGSTTAPPPGPGNNNERNWIRKNTKYLEKKLETQGTDPHSVKYEYLGKHCRVSRYDLWVDKYSGQVAIIEKATGKIVEVTDYFIY